MFRGIDKDRSMGYGVSFFSFWVGYGAPLLSVVRIWDLVLGLI